MNAKLSSALAVALLLAGCGGDTPTLEKPINTMEDGPGASSNTGGTGSTSDLQGTWRYEYVSNGCIETYKFSSSTSAGQFTVTALDEVASGNYTNTLVEGSTVRYELTFRYTADNSGADCLGRSDDDSNTIVTRYYEIVGNNLNIYSSPSSTTVNRTYKKS